VRHISSAIANDLSKLSDDKLAHIRDVANSDTASTSIKGANRPAGQVDMARKIGPHRTDGPPSFIAPPRTGSTKPPADWPTPTHGPFSSGLAKKASLGSMPSKDAPSR
jgi:hypothetical protein